MTFFLTPTEHVALKRLLKVIQVDKRGFILSIVLGVIGLGSSIALAATAAWLIARASQHPPVLWLTVAAVAVRMFGVLRALMRYLQRLTSHRVALRGMDALRLHVYETLAHTRIDRVAALHRGDLLSRTGADIDAVGDLVVKSLLPAFVALIVGVGTVVGFAFISLPTAIILALCLLISGVLTPAVTMRATRVAETASGQARVALADGVMTVMEGAAELALAGKLDAVHTQIHAAEKDLHTATHRASAIAGLATGLDRLAMGAAVLAAMLIGIPQTYEGTILAVSLAVLVLTPLAAFEGTAEMSPAAVQLVRSAQAAQRIDALLGDTSQATDEATQAPQATSQPKQTTSSAPFTPQEATTTTSSITAPTTQQPVLELRDCAIGWPGGPTIAYGLNLRLGVGDRIAIVGPSGVGKTTLLLTMAGMLPPISGNATLNGQSLWETNRHTVTSQVTMTAEDAHIFATTVWENLKVANPDISADQAQAVLNIMGLGTWVESLPSGLDTLLGSGGTSVSGGERRRLLMARALSAPSPLILADEASEHLDPQTADSLVRTLYQQAQDHNRGIAIVTHRLSALESADTIIMLGKEADGSARVIAQGSHEELIHTCAEYRWALEQEA